MGIRKSTLPAGGVAGALFTPVQQRVLGLLFGQPGRRFRSSEIIRLAGSGTGAVHRQLQRLAAAGLVTVSSEGNQKYYQARKHSPVFEELCGLVRKTVGLLEPIRLALLPLVADIRVAFVYGSLAKASDRATSDADLLVISDRIDYPELYEALAPAERVLARQINPKIMRPEEWKRKGRRDSFVSRIASQPKLFVVGGADDLP